MIEFKNNLCNFLSEIQTLLEQMLDQVIEQGEFRTENIRLVQELYPYYVPLIQDVCFHCPTCTDIIHKMNVTLKLLDGEMTINIAKLNLKYIELNSISAELLDITDGKAKRIEHEFKDTFVRSTEKKLVYFDHNILVKYEEDKEFQTLVENCKDRFCFYYSPSHLEEITKRSNEEKRSYILGKIVDLTNELTILPWNGGFKIGYENPQFGMKRIELHGKEATSLVEKWKVVMNKYNDIEYEEYFTEQHKKSINNKDLFHKDKQLLENALLRANAGFQLEEIRDSNVLLAKYEFTNNVFYKIYKAFDILNFYKEKNIKSSIHDIEHLIYALSSEIFVTSDKVCFQRSKSIFSYIKPSPVVYTIESFIHELKTN